MRLSLDTGLGISVVLAGREKRLSHQRALAFDAPVEDLIPDQLNRGVAGRRIDGEFGKVQGKSGIAFCRPASLRAPPASNASLRQRRSNPWALACSFLNSNYFKLEVSFSTALH